MVGPQGRRTVEPRGSKSMLSLERERCFALLGLPGVSRRAAEVPGVAFGDRKSPFRGPNRVSKGSNRSLKVLQVPSLCTKQSIRIDFNNQNVCSK